ncbi:hypothetical protein [Brevibacillus fortis]|uniref:hypothetical protein n=1 Tax=Brevibacillus fortis TaxID=2126352 RepID=UPI0038FD3392
MLAHYNGSPAVVIELGVPPTHKQAFYGVVKPLIAGEDRDRNWTKSGILHSPVFVDFILFA